MIMMMNKDKNQIMKIMKMSNDTKQIDQNNYDQWVPSAIIENFIPENEKNSDIFYTSFILCHLYLLDISVLN